MTAPTSAGAVRPIRQPDAIDLALARYREVERELHDAHMAMIRDLRDAFTPTALGRIEE